MSVNEFSSIEKLQKKLIEIVHNTVEEGERVKFQYTNDCSSEEFLQKHAMLQHYSVSVSMGLFVGGLSQRI